jgi:hypothetical protein
MDHGHILGSGAHVCSFAGDVVIHGSRTQVYFHYHSAGLLSVEP